jgi:hypothetical protein
MMSVINLFLEDDVVSSPTNKITELAHQQTGSLVTSHQPHIDRHLIPCATCTFLLPAALAQAQVHSSPLLKEKRDFDSQALIPNASDSIPA